MYRINKKCVQCGMCEMVCPKEAISIRNRNYYIDELVCDNCLEIKRPICREVCPIKKAIVTKNFPEF
ncbi:4Fe-4S binding protein [Candidatus Riesia pediculicola]|uniref:NapF protein n=1 Tax=Riesia pediculicola (strain USDA) TaxID=515618 RepID=D4G8C0_RIEPU|nr:4Fe-4S binding protein [Candidatus Riesia pediculicola]ADD79479.1 NapF protein [Candidatus Riesia pediculicola USDA]QOJ86446.1 4Fe-4S binding protein [Candidatus Riesia pediculicola]